MSNDSYQNGRDGKSFWGQGYTSSIEALAHGWGEQERREAEEAASKPIFPRGHYTPKVETDNSSSSGGWLGGWLIILLLIGGGYLASRDKGSTGNNNQSRPAPAVSSASDVWAIATVSDDVDLNLRQCGSSDCAILATMPKGTRVQVIGNGSADHTWAKLRVTMSDGSRITGYANGKFLRLLQ